ncbi:MAG: hypothetical protein AAGA17_11000 [Actinomycetota bacterium]
MSLTEPTADVDSGDDRAPFSPPLPWIWVAVIVGVALAAMTYVVRDVDGVVARAELLAEDGGRVSAFDRANATADALRTGSAFASPPDGVEEVVISVRPGQAIVDVEVVAGLEGEATAHLDRLVEEALAASRDEEIRILETQIAELEISLDRLDADDAAARRIQADIEVRRGQLAVLTGLVQVVGTPTISDREAAPARDAVVVGLAALVAVGVFLPWAGRRRE